MAGRGRGGKIRPPRRGITGHGDGDFDTMWDLIRNALREIHTKNASKLSFEQLYRASYKIVLKKKGDILYERVKEFEEQWFAAEVMPGIRALITENLVGITLGNVPGTTTNEKRMTGEKFMKGLKESWEDHILCMNMTTDILMYLDRVYCGDNRKATIFATSMGLFRDHILRERIVGTQEPMITFDILNSVILDQIQMEREGDVIDKSLISSCTHMLMGLYETDSEADSERLYVTVFEPVFLEASRQFYRKECQTLLRESDASSWLRQTQKRLIEESDRCKTTVQDRSSQLLIDVVEQEMIAHHLHEFISLEGSGVKAMIDNDRFDDLTILYNNISRIDPSKEALRDALQNRVVSLGVEINKTIANTNFALIANDDEAGDKGKQQPLNQAAQQTVAAIKWVDEVLQLKDKFDGMWKHCFNEDLILQTALTRSFSEFINVFPRSPENVSLFIDENLKRGIKGKTESEVDAVLDKATTLLRYLQDKDMFERYYKKHLARRLLQGKSESADVEKQMISRMKMEVGNYFTTKLEGMFKDMSMSEELTSGYRTHIHSLGDMDKKQIDLGVNVLTSNFWPMESMGAGGPSVGENGLRMQCTWPHEIKSLQDSFTKYYLKERNGRQLTWLGFVGTADIRCIFPKISGKDGMLGRERRYEITVTTYGMVVLLLFNNLAPDASLTFEEIHEATMISSAELARQLTILSVLPKARVLLKDPATKQVKTGDRFFFNETFSSKSIKIKAPTITGVNKVEGDEERKYTESRNDEMRAGVIEAALVRIMKQRKELPHQQLFAETATQLSNRFKPEPSMVKKRIESLIEREYLERVEDAVVPTYRYLA